MAEMKFYTPKEASKYSKNKLSERFIRDLCDEKRILGAKKIKNRWKIPVDSFHEYLHG